MRNQIPWNPIPWGMLFSLLFPTAAFAQPVSGLYIAAGAGVNFMTPEKLSATTYPTSVTPGQQSIFAASFNPNTADVASVGFGFGNGFRVEAEADYRYNDIIHESHGFERKYGGMANALYDFDPILPWLVPYVGGGVGLMQVDRDSLGTHFNANEFSYQGIAGIAFPIAPIPGLAITTEYRFLGLTGGKGTTQGFVTGPSTTTPVTFKYYHDYNNSLMIGLRYSLNSAPPAPPPAPPPPPAAPAPTVSREYIVFFDWDRADLSARARQIISEAARNATRVFYTRIEVSGYTDQSGTADYNRRLSVRRAEAVAAELVRDGVPRAAIAIRGYGESNPLVPTAKGAREPQNRRVEIVIK